VSRRADPAAGGVALGGRAGNEPAGTDPAAGGVALGGAAGDVYTPGGVTPGADCATAGACVLGVTYGATTPAFPGEDWWRVSGLTPGATYHVETTGVGIPNAGLVGHYGASCAALSLLMLGHPAPNCYEFVAPAAAFVWFVFTPGLGGPSAYTWKLLAGAC